MELRFDYLLVSFLCNLGICLAQFAIQELDRREGAIMARHSLIPGTHQKFLYWQDFSTQTWGDMLGLGLVWVAFAHIKHMITPLGWVMLTGIGLASAVAFWAMCTRSTHKPDWGYPRMAQTSAGGSTHLVYFGTSTAFAVACLPYIIGGALKDWPLALFLIGSVIWTAAACVDWAAGRFEKLKPIVPPPK